MVGDFNGDGKLDVAYVDSGFHLKVALGKGDGTFQAPTASTEVELPFYVGQGQLAIGKVNGNGDDDLVVAGGIHNGGNETAGYQVITDVLGTFTQKSTVPISIPDEAAVLGLAVGDYDGDGKEDLAILAEPYAGGPETAVYGEVGQGDGTFTAAPENPILLGLTGSERAYSDATANLDGSGGDDLLVGVSHNFSTLPLLGSSSGFLTLHAAGAMEGGTGLPVQVAAAELTGSGLDEAISGYFDGQGSFGVGISDGSGNLTAAPGSPFHTSQEHFFDSSIGVGDFNGDGYPDIAIGSYANGGTVTQGVAVMINSRQLKVEPSSLFLGDAEVGTTLTGHVTLTGLGAPTAEVSEVEIADEAESPFSLVEPNACETVAYGETCEIEVAFSPTVEGAWENTLYLTSDTGPGGADAVSVVTLHGEAEAPGVRLTPATEDFGSVTIGGTPVTRSLKIESTGGMPLNVTKVSLSSEADFKLAEPSACVKSLDEGESCKVSVAFDPSGSAGARSATLTVATNAGDATAQLSGTATAPSSSSTGGGGSGNGGGTNPVPSPAAAKLKLNAPTTVKPGKTVNLKIQVTNTGGTAISGLALTVKGPKRLVGAARTIQVGSLGAGKSVTKTIRVKVKARARKGAKFAVAVDAVAGGKTLATGSRSVKVK